MNPLVFILGIPACAAVLCAFIPTYRFSAGLNVCASLLTFVASLFLLGSRPETTLFFLVDEFNIYLILLTAFVALTTSLFSFRYIGHEIEVGKLLPRYVRYYHSMYQAFIFTMLLALTANNFGIMWVALEGATLSTVFLVGLYRTPQAIEAAWKYLILCGSGIALALFGTTLLYLAAQPIVGEGLPAMAWSVLLPNTAAFDPMALNLAFVFLLIGYGTKAGLVPLHAWLPDAHAEGPAPVSAVLSGLLLNVALYAVLRFKILLAGNAGALPVGPLMIAMGLGSLLLAGFMMYRRPDVKRLFAYSSIEHMGIATFAFGMGGMLANFAGLLHMMMHSLTKSAIFFNVGFVSQVKKTQKIANIRGLTSSHPLLGWMLVLGVVAIAGMPPFGVFLSEFLLVTSTFARQPLLGILLVIGLLAGFGALVLRLQGMAFGSDGAEGKAEDKTDGKTAYTIGAIALAPIFLHLGLVVVAGVYLPDQLVAWFQHVARLLG